MQEESPVIVSFGLNIRGQTAKLHLEISQNEAKKLYDLCWRRYEKASKELDKLLIMMSDSFLEKADIDFIGEKLIKAIASYDASLVALDSAISCLSALR